MRTLARGVLAVAAVLAGCAAPRVLTRPAKAPIMAPTEGPNPFPAIATPDTRAQR